MLPCHLQGSMVTMDYCTQRVRIWVVSETDDKVSMGWSGGFNWAALLPTPSSSKSVISLELYCHVFCHIIPKKWHFAQPKVADNATNNFR